MGRPAAGLVCGVQDCLFFARTPEKECRQARHRVYVREGQSAADPPVYSERLAQGYCAELGHAFVAYVAHSMVWQRWCAVCGANEVGEQLSFADSRRKSDAR